jgi:hypothetical protein
MIESGPADAEASTCRDLVAVTPAEPKDGVPHSRNTRSSATFLAHLIATAEGLPQTREKRRLAPEDASRRYVAAQDGRPSRRTRLASL